MAHNLKSAKKYNDGFTPTAAAVAVKVIFVGAGETRRPTKLKALATDSLEKSEISLGRGLNGERKTRRMKEGIRD